jgi:hypothetical protein
MSRELKLICFEYVVDAISISLSKQKLLSKASFTSRFFRNEVDSLWDSWVDFGNFAKWRAKTSFSDALLEVLGPLSSVQVSVSDLEESLSFLLRTESASDNSVCRRKENDSPRCLKSLIVTCEALRESGPSTLSSASKNAFLARLTRESISDEEDSTDDDHTSSCWVCRNMSSAAKKYYL